MELLDNGSIMINETLLTDSEGHPKIAIDSENNVHITWSASIPAWPGNELTFQQQIMYKTNALLNEQYTNEDMNKNSNKKESNNYINGFDMIIIILCIMITCIFKKIYK
jgi:hypothetical protein